MRSEVQESSDEISDDQEGEGEDELDGNDSEGDLLLREGQYNLKRCKSADLIPTIQLKTSKKPLKRSKSTNLSTNLNNAKKPIKKISILFTQTNDSVKVAV